MGNKSALTTAVEYAESAGWSVRQRDDGTTVCALGLREVWIMSDAGGKWIAGVHVVVTKSGFSHHIDKIKNGDDAMASLMAWLDDKTPVQESFMAGLEAGDGDFLAKIDGIISSGMSHHEKG